ncbi:MAG: riboflavin synthase [Planctomycetota bacterium]
MFTGLVQTIGTVIDSEPTPAGRCLRIQAEWCAAISHGDSISVSGCCLTVANEPVADGGPGVLDFDVVHETLARTVLGGFQAGARVNLETSCTPTTMLGGHVVQGHVDGVGTVKAVTSDGEWRVAVGAPCDLMPCITPKGSVTVDGVSLTVAAVDTDAECFELALIPVTLEKTTLGGLRVGDRCNLETDILARTVVHWLSHYQGRD